MIFFKIRVIIFWGDFMQTLVCEISWAPFYRGEEATYPCQYRIEKNGDLTNFINFDGTYYGLFHGEQLIDVHHTTVDYVIFVAKNQSKQSYIVGWYKNATLYADEQYYDPEQPFYVKANDTDVVLLDEKDRQYLLSIQGPWQWIQMDRRLANYLKQTKRINYRRQDLNVSTTLALADLETTCEFIEKEMTDMHYFQALRIVNRALLTFGRLASLIYYKAWILYAFQQYKQASLLLMQIKDLAQFHDFACYMLGNIYFETGAYETSITMFEAVKKLNPDQTAYMLAQSYAMLSDIKQAMKAIDQAIMLNPEESVYRDFKDDLRKWSYE